MIKSQLSESSQLAVDNDKMVLLVGLSVMCTLFSSNIHLAFLSLVRAESLAGITSKVFLAALLVFDIVVAALVTRKYPRTTDARIVVLIFSAYAILCVALFLTYSSAVFTSTYLKSEIESYAVVWLACMTAAYSLVRVGSYGFRGIDRVIPLIIVIYTFGSLFALVFSTGQTSGGLLLDNSGLNYQANSYCAAYAIGLSLYYLTSSDWEKRKNNSKNIPLRRMILFGMLICQSIVLVLSGGRGGLVMAILTVLYFVYSQRRVLSKNVLQIAKGVFLLTVLVVAFLLIIGCFDSNSIGFARILAFLDGGGDENRAKLASLAINAFQESPVIGHGPGSVFNLFGTYSHNFILDILVEYGLLGLALTVFCGLLVCSKLSILMKQYKEFGLVPFLLIMGFSMLLFSGYYLISPSIVLPTFAVILWPFSAVDSLKPKHSE